MRTVRNGLIGAAAAGAVSFALTTVAIIGASWVFGVTWSDHGRAFAATLTCGVSFMSAIAGCIWGANDNAD